jgi:hypothetical protein
MVEAVQKIGGNNEDESKSKIFRRSLFAGRLGVKEADHSEM